MGNRNFITASNFYFSTDLFGGLVEYNIQAVNLPGLGFNHIKINKNSIKGNIQGDTLEFDMLSVTVILDEDFLVWKKMVNTLLLMREPYHSTSEYITKNATLFIKNHNSKTILKLEFNDVQLERIGEVEFTTTEDEGDIITSTIDLTYDFFTIK